MTAPSRSERDLYRVDPAMLPPDIQRDLIARCLRSCRDQGLTRAVVYPAGGHSERVGLEPFESAGVTLDAFADDARTGRMHGRPIHHPESLLPGPQFVLISSDSVEHRCAARARQWAGARGIEVVRPYAALDREGAERALAGREQAIARLLRESNGKLNFGCGLNPLPGWTNIDGGDGTWWSAPDLPGVIPLDAFDALAALPDHSCTRVYSEHFYEHFTLDDGHRMAREWARLLVPGGVVRIVMPDLEREARMYLGEQLPTTAERLERHKRRWLGTRHRAEANRFLTPAMVFNFGVRLDGHQFVYDFPTAKAQLESAGFVEVVRCRFGESRHPDLRGIDHHLGGETGGGWTKEIQLVVEAIRAP